MCIVSAETFLLWKEKQLLKGGDDKSLSLLIDSVGGLSKKDINLFKIKSETNIKLKLQGSGKIARTWKA